MITEMPSAIRPIRIASAEFCSSTISFQRLKGVSRSIATKASRNVTIPRTAKMTAARMLLVSVLMGGYLPPK